MDAHLVIETQEKMQELLQLLGVEASVLVEVGEEEIVHVSIEGKEKEESAESEGLGILIGYHGYTLRSLQSILSLMVNRDKPEWVKVVVDIGGYRKNHDESLVALAKRTVEKARFLKEEVPLSPMNSYDRRIIHTTISEIDDMDSESAGEEPRRRVIVRPKQ